MTIDFAPLTILFSKKPLLVGGKAMEYYGLRKSGNDTDLVVSQDDFVTLLVTYSNNVKDIYGDLGIVVNNFEVWKTIRYFDYEYLAQGAVEESNCLVISLEKLLFQKALAMDISKYHADLELVVKKINELQGEKAEAIKEENSQYER